MLRYLDAIIFSDTFYISEDRWNLFPLKTDKCAKPIGSRSYTFRARKARRLEVHKCVIKMASALNYAYDDKIGYERETVNSKIASLEGSRVSAVQGRRTRYL